MNLLKSSAVILPFFPGEYDYYTSLGGIQSINESPSVQEYALPDGTSYTARFIKCSCAGMCVPHAARPLICRIYPYYPRVDLNGKILGFGHSALMDVLYEAPETNHPCTLVREEKERIQSELRDSLPVLLQYPEFIFVFKVLEIIERELRQHLPKRIDLLEDNDAVKSFFRNFEWAVLSRKPWATELVATEIGSIYNSLVQEHGLLVFN